MRASPLDVTVGWAAAGDTNLDGIVDTIDVAELIGADRFGRPQAAAWSEGDFNYDGLFDVLDVAEMLGAVLFDRGSYRSVVPPPEPTRAPTASPPAVEFAITGSWPGNFSGAVTIRNPGSTLISGWILEFDIAATIAANNLWGAEIVSVSGTRYRLRNASWTATVAAGGSVTFTFNAGGEATARMTNTVFNGLAAV